MNEYTNISAIPMGYGGEFGGLGRTRTRFSECQWHWFKAELTPPWCPHKRLCGRSGTTLAAISALHVGTTGEFGGTASAFQA